MMGWMGWIGWAVVFEVDVMRCTINLVFDVPSHCDLGL